MSTLITVLHVIVCLFLMLTVLLQSGKGGGMGAAFGGSSAGTVFGGSGASGFLQKLTAVAGTVFMMTSVVLAYLSSAHAADALDSFGKEQEEMADQKEKAKTKALKSTKPVPGQGSQQGSNSSMKPPTPTGSGSGSGGEIEGLPETPLTPMDNPPVGSGGDKITTPPPANGSDTNTKPDPKATPKAPANGSDAKAPAPAPKTGSGSGK